MYVFFSTKRVCRTAHCLWKGSKLKGFFSKGKIDSCVNRKISWVLFSCSLFSKKYKILCHATLMRATGCVFPNASIFADTPVRGVGVWYTRRPNIVSKTPLYAAQAGSRVWYDFLFLFSTRFVRFLAKICRKHDKVCASKGNVYILTAACVFLCHKLAWYINEKRYSMYRLDALCSGRDSYPARGCAHESRCFRTKPLQTHFPQGMHVCSGMRSVFISVGWRGWGVSANLCIALVAGVGHYCSREER